MRSDLLTTSQREHEREALELVLAGVAGALTVLPDESAWRRCFLEIKMCLTAAIKRHDEES